MVHVFNMPGPTELLIILFIVLLIFGAGKLPDTGRALGKAIKEFKSAREGLEDDTEKGNKEKKEDA